MIDKINPAVKLLFLICYCSALFLVRGDYGFYYLKLIFLFVVLIIWVIASKIRLYDIFRALLPVCLIVVFSFFVCLISLNTEKAVLSAIRIVFTVIASFIFRKTTDMYLLSGSLSSVFGRSISDIITTAVCFIPVLAEQGKRILIIHKQRVAKGSRKYMSLIIPMFVCTIRRAGELSDAMKLRYYDQKCSKTRYRKAGFAFPDVLVFLLSVFIVSVCAWRFYV